jgi:hypothetical protein
MPANNVEQIKIWKSAHIWLMNLSKARKALGESSASMTSLASQAILSIPMPNGNNHNLAAAIAASEESGPEPSTTDLTNVD